MCYTYTVINTICLFQSKKITFIIDRKKLIITEYENILKFNIKNLRNYLITNLFRRFNVEAYFIQNIRSVCIVFHANVLANHVSFCWPFIFFRVIIQSQWSFGFNVLVLHDTFNGGHLNEVNED